MAVGDTIQLREFCRLFQFGDREVRYVLERGYVPDGVRRAPSTGHRREFAPDQAYWLAILVKLKHAGLRTPLAARAADYATGGLRTITQNLSWDFQFLPMNRQFDTEHQYFLDIGDRECIRLVTDACPGRSGLHALDWHPVKGKREAVPNFRPFVTIRLDLVRIAEALKQVEAWS